MIKDDAPAIALNAVAWLTTAAQTNDIMRYISLSLTIIATALSCAYTIYKWYKRATRDGKIDEQEVEELVDELNNELKKGKDNIDDKR